MGEKCKDAFSYPVHDACDPPKDDISRLDIKVGQITFTQQHPLNNKLYINHVMYDGEREKPVISYLRKHYTRKELKNKLVVMICNVRYKVRKMVSEGFILFAQTENKHELLSPPCNAKIGHRITVRGYPFHPCEQFYVSPHKEGERLMGEIVKDMKVNSEGQAEYRGIPLLTDEGDFITTASLRNCNIIN